MRFDLHSDSFLSHLRRASIVLGAALLLLLFALLLPTAWAGDDGGGALDFDGAGDHVDINDIGLNLSAFTIEFWIKPDTTVHDRRIMGNLTGDATDYALRFSGNRIQIWPDSQGSQQWVYITSSTIPADQWTHIAIVHSADLATGYVNGVQELTGVENDPTGADDLGLGAPLLLGSGSYFDGQMDEVRFWNTARTQAQIQANMHAQLGGSEAGLQAYYRLDDGDPSTTATDSANNYDGTLVNGPTWVAASTAPIGDSTAAGQSEISALWSPVDPASSGGLILTNVSFLRGIGDDIVFGHNNLTGNSDQDLPGSWPPNAARWQRVWYCDLYDEPTVTGGTVGVTFDYDDAGMGAYAPAGATGNYKLLERTGTTGDFVEIATATAFDTGAKTVTFSGVSAGTVCSYITLGTLNNIGSSTAVTLGGVSARPVAATAAALLLGPLALGTLGLALWKRTLQKRRIG